MPKIHAPTHLKHKPILEVCDYDQIDGRIAKKNADAKALSIGYAQYDDTDISAKIWRHTGQNWSRQSEELPIHRLLDLAILAIGSLLIDETSNYPVTILREEIVEGEDIKEIKDFFKTNKTYIEPRLKSLKVILDKVLEKGI